VVDLDLSEVMEMTDETTFWRDDTTHTVENVGATEARAIAIELKPCAR
jgi:hypothetical protein